MSENILYTDNEKIINEPCILEDGSIVDESMTNFKLEEENIIIEEDHLVASYSIYARPDENGKVIKVFSTCFEQPLETDILVKTGEGDEFVHVGYYDLYTDDFCHIYKIVDGIMVKCTEEDLEAERATKPAPTPTQSQRITTLEEEVTSTQMALTEQYETNLTLEEELSAAQTELVDTQMALVEQYEANLALEEELTNTQMALAEVYEQLIALQNN